MSSNAFEGALDAVGAMRTKPHDHTPAERQAMLAELEAHRTRLEAREAAGGEGDATVAGNGFAATTQVLAWMLADAESQSDTPPANAVGDGLPEPSPAIQAAMAELDAMDLAMLADTAEQAQRTCTELLELAEGLAERHGITGMPPMASSAPAGHTAH